MLMEEASLRCVMVDSEGLALLNCLGQCDKGLQGSSAILNVGKEVATVVVLGENGVPFIRDIGYGGVDVAAEKLVGDVNETLAYYSMSNGCEKVKRIYVCGENSLGDGFAEVLGDGIAGDVLAWNPFVHLHCAAAVADAGLVQRCGSALAIAAGLAMREV
jgi:Tfp pilus assembly PilM family ATPase